MVSLLFSALLWALQGVESIWYVRVPCVNMSWLAQVPNGVPGQLVGYKTTSGK